MLCIDTFLKYFADWKTSIATRPGEFTDNARANMFLSWQTYQGIKITVHSSIELIKYLLLQGVPYVLTERFCQDPLENYFGRQRSMGHRKDNPSLRDFGYNDNTIRTQNFLGQLQEIVVMKTPSLLRLMLRLCLAVRAIENRAYQDN